MSKLHYSLLLICLLNASCATVAYKRGANTDTLKEAQISCQSGNHNDASTQKCLEENGREMQEFDAFDPVVVIMQTDNRMPGMPMAGNSTATKAQSSPDKIANPLDVYQISSWWKAGGNEATLNTTLKDCVAKLGADHQPDAAHRQATRGLLLCMREYRWYGLQSKEHP